jgi:hypothetical protein
MIVVLHEGIGMDDDAEALVRFPQAVQEEVSVIVRDEYGLLSISPGGHVIKRSGEFDPE